jgi:hypothetical protein
VANADFTKRLERTSVEAESILSSNHWIPTKTLQRRNGTGANRRNERLTMVLLYRALAGTSRSPSTILATEASISDWHLGCIVAFGRMTVMEWIVLGFLLMHLLLLFGVLGGLLHTHFAGGCRNKSRGESQGLLNAKGDDPRDQTQPFGSVTINLLSFDLDIWGQSLIPNLQIEKPVTQEL